MTGRQPSSGSVNAKQLLEVLQAVKRGDFSARMPSDRTGMAGKIYDTLNEIIELNEQTTKEMEEVAQEVGKEGKTKRRASAATAQGAWKTHVETFNTLIDDLVRPVTEVTSVIGSVANGDLSKAMSL
ncbi:MAG: hypothetical protein ISR77_17205, partial [Pirellulaceae bacterium]|nr:hypothetical protein [Pirellulaceae bacterium]